MAEQPGALHLYPPSRGRFAVPRDHFRFTSAAQFDLTYLSYDAFARDARSPVLFYAGNEGAVELFYNNSGALFTLASRLGARLLFAEHRYYGSSLPFGAASFTPANLSLLSVEQALADYAALLLALPAELGCRSARPSVDPSRPLCDTVLFGGSYGGMLAAWHRVRYPHLSLGAVASGAPVDFYDGVQSRFAAAVNRTFAVYGGKGSGCSSALQAALAAADAATPSQLVAAGVRPCDPMGGDAAMLDYPYQSRFVGLLPPNPVRRACGDLLAPGEPLRRLHSAVLRLVNGTGALRCVDLRAELVGGRPGWWADGSDLGACTELPLEPITSDGFGFYPEASGKQAAQLADRCADRFGVQPRPGWMGLAFGHGADYRHHSNLLFVENDKDPWQIGTESVASGGSVRRFVAAGGAHHQDLRFPSPLDAPGVSAARRVVEETSQTERGGL
ncbi:hypothetical protein EMIHUDRAFT_241178 [Emiliania huxleyi CCMP1516]|uniref:Lysosomal Pro-X carboxypeptidase n=2 Tax=Emiliania huxleyi TaxID=2903 RepID=A0A0D3JD35_EMIH1|nr:hypothetical protein EMIHUDRAFT_241178 [Emiliania huxleyi CCMP1516]EOD21420.1 hypothetical protein EMIHUDRAFT_241178 [Emiliania huxleyi CCMP1516]|eukprot:XP_005773849.1 hypothetical protein EMIHUDRAFT_241178 [Emiliania huxleyi CCMP1516]